MIAAAALILAPHPTFSFVFVAEILHGATAGIMTPAIAAISLGIVGRRAMSSRIGRNHRFDAAGSALTAGIMGALGSYVGKSTIFLAAAGLTVAALGFVRKDEIDYERARNAPQGSGESTAGPAEPCQEPAARVVHLWHGLVPIGQRFRAHSSGGEHRADQLHRTKFHRTSTKNKSWNALSLRQCNSIN
jgi:hypothetical protein